MSVNKKMCSMHNTFRHKKEARQRKFTFLFHEAVFTHNTNKEPYMKIQNLILQQSNIFQSAYIDSQLICASSYFMQVTILNLCLLYTRLLTVQKVDFTFRSSDLICISLYLLALNR